MGGLRGLIVLLLLLIAPLSGCDRSGIVVGDLAPADVYSSIEDGASGVAVNQPITVGFVKAVDTATVTAQSFFLVEVVSSASVSRAEYDAASCDPTRAVPGRVVCESSTSCSFTPDQALSSEATYLVCLTTAIQYADGNIYPGKVLQFTTADAAPPIVMQFTPANNATEVAVNTGMQVVFSEEMDPLSISSSTILLEVDGAAMEANVSLSLDGRIVTIAPLEALASYTLHTLRVLGAVKDRSGNLMGDAVSIQFRTADVIAPTITAMTPADGGDDVARGSSIQVVFSEAMDEDSITTSAIQVSSAFGSVDGNVSYDAATQTLTFTPASALFGNTTYEVSLATTLRDEHGVAIAITPAKSFRTELARVVKIAAGAYQVLALMEDQTVWIWGGNYSGQLGNGTLWPVASPYHMTSLTGVIDISASAQHTVIVCADGSVWAWGRNAYGQLGDGTTTMRLTPVRMLDPSDPTGFMTGATAAFAGTDLTVVVKGTESVWALGLNSSGQLGDGTTTNRTAPVRVHGVNNVGYLTDFLQVSATFSNAIAILNDGQRSVVAWGNNASGQIGDNTSGAAAYKTAPVKVHGENNVGFLTGALSVQISTAMGSAVMQDGRLLTWGSNSFGNLGTGNQVNRIYPGAVVGVGGVGTLANVVAASCFRSCVALLNNGNVLVWGDGMYGHNGIGGTANQLTPIAVPGMGSVKQVLSMTFNNFLVLQDEKTIVASGYNIVGTLGDGSATYASFSPSSFAWLEDVVEAGGGYELTILRHADGSVWAYGNNTWGGVGDGTNTTRESPVAVKDPDVPTSPLTGVSSIAAGYSSGMAIKNGQVIAWGLNTTGQLGNGELTNRNIPIWIPGLSNIIKVTPGMYHTVALRDDNADGEGELWAWGNNGVGQVGNGKSGENVTTPVRVCRTYAGGTCTAYFYSDIVDMCAAYNNTMALRADGTVWAWGENSNGNIGDNGACGVNCLLPVQVPGLTNITQISCHTRAQFFALRNDGTVWAWGSDSLYGAIGLGHYAIQSTPAQIPELSSIKEIATGYYSGHALETDGTLWGWGYNFFGQLAVSDTADHPSPVKSNGPRLQSLYAGRYVMYGRGLDGRFLLWGMHPTVTMPDGSLQWRDTYVTVKWR